MAFGPESDNPRERRAYAHVMIKELARGKASYGAALLAACRASGTVKGRASCFENALSNAAKSAVQIEQGASGHRGIRRVPLSWQHPTDENGHFIPLYDTREPRSGQYTIAELEYMIKDGSARYEDVVSWYMPTFKGVPAEEMGICLYETTTEGIPLTPVFPDTEQGHKDLATYAAKYATTFADRQAPAEVWEQRFFGQPKIVA